nr:immunoglobulin heavy chain junction region [Macaca mulatta]MOY24459.1 immunoglobulin heavy chain junction region [Macaca mulatta]MOY24949.1 immunoglobulin heavy chain junction region [Macaca mulatta]MOY25340.1 immunoglobulin heavy chain junction region [Macaca mulatta]MOY25454.1 immunoglobulin heavy chain junction region [Macaca mulatta]
CAKVDTATVWYGLDSW